MVMQEHKLIEKHGNGLQAQWRVLNGPAPINDGIVAGSLHFGAIGTSSVVMLWAKTRKKLGIRLAGALSSMPMWLNTSDPNIKSIKDFSTKDKIAFPSVKIGVQGVTLQKAAADAFGEANFARLDPLTVGMSHPDAFVALLSGGSITAHFAAPPFQQQEIEQGKGKVHTVLKSNDVWGGKAMFTGVVATTRFRKDNPQAYGAFGAALKEASDWINANHDAAAAIYLKVTGSKESLPWIKSLLDDPENSFDLTPYGLAKYAKFMHQNGTIKELAQSWQDLCHENLHALGGS